MEQTVRISDRLDGPRYRVSYTDHNGHKAKSQFYTRTAAVIFLNKCILDWGYSDATLRLLPKRKVVNVQG